MMKVSPEWIAQIENQYPGITKHIEYFENKALPPCPKCGSVDTATVNAGIIGRTIYLASATTKFHLRASDRPGEFYCNICKEYFG